VLSNLRQRRVGEFWMTLGLEFVIDRLSQLPLEALKIDRSLVNACCSIARSDILELITC